MKVLISAYACEPGEGSEAGVGWNWVCQAARFHEVWAITREKNRTAIESSLATEPLPRVHWVYYDPPGWPRLGRKTPRGYDYYFLWQLGAYLVAKKLHREVGFDLVHHATLVNYWAPSFLSLLPIPFVWGPVGGGESAPRSFRRTFSLRGKAYEFLRDLARSLAQLNPIVRLTARRAAVGLATTPQTEERLRALGCRNIARLSQVGLSLEEIHCLGNFPPLRQDARFRVLSVGGLLHLKGFNLGLQAFARLQSRIPACEYWIIGDGPERNRLEGLARQICVAEKVRFLGALPRREVLRKLADTDVLLHPALHESGGLVCLEAMAAARPVICLDLGGPALEVTEETGIKIPAVSPSQAIADLSLAMEELARNPARRTRLGQAGRERVSRLYNWQEKGKYLAALYSQAVSAKLQGELRPLRA